MKKIKNLIVSVSFQIGVNIIGLPLFETHVLNKTIFLSTSKFHK
jgi:hypothetical protein